MRRKSGRDEKSLLFYRWGYLFTVCSFPPFPHFPPRRRQPIGRLAYAVIWHTKEPSQQRLLGIMIVGGGVKGKN